MALQNVKNAPAPQTEEKLGSWMQEKALELYPETAIN
jgi:hypothetical protein|tara:strand:- start:460 stop:570 length:111 start_codon:yes stop_codon:yes gene_type:complete